MSCSVVRPIGRAGPPGGASLCSVGRRPAPPRQRQIHRRPQTLRGRRPGARSASAEATLAGARPSWGVAHAGMGPAGLRASRDIHRHQPRFQAWRDRRARIAGEAEGGRTRKRVVGAVGCWTMALLVVALVVAGEAMSSLYAGQQACFFNFPAVACPGGDDRGCPPDVRVLRCAGDLVAGGPGCLRYLGGT